MKVICVKSTEIYNLRTNNKYVQNVLFIVNKNRQILNI